MKVQLYLFITFFASITACKKDTNVSTGKKEVRCLLSGIIIIEGDTSHFEYNNKNQLIKWTRGSDTISDSITCDAFGNLLTSKYRYHSNVGYTAVSVVCTYNNNTILRIETQLPNESALRTLSGIEIGRMIKKEQLSFPSTTAYKSFCSLAA
jgi:hypothetical protein